MKQSFQRVLIIDDLFGRDLPGAPNREREHLCGKFLLQNEPEAEKPKVKRFEIPDPIATACFCRGQTPVCAKVGDTVEGDLEAALVAVRNGWPEAKTEGGRQKAKLRWSMVLLDLCFYTGVVTEESHRQTPGMPEGRPGDDDPRSYFGLTLLDAIHQEFPELPIFILSSKPRGDVSLEFSKRGALGFIARDDLRGPELLEEALWQHGLLPDPAGEVVGDSLPILLALREARRAARHRENLLIRGERGTGKELLAGYVHRMSSTAKDAGNRPFVTVNSAVFTPNLFASELFGIQARTATGVDGKIGLIESAHRGDLFLDEIADIPPEVQAAVLRVLQERQIVRVGAREPMDVDVRFLSATNAELEDESRGFRPDLLDRLRLGGTVWLPPLRERPTDIPLLAEKFVREAESQRKGAMWRNITPEAMSTLVAHKWPGNIRELRSAIFDAVNRFPDVEHLVPPHLRLKMDPGSTTVPGAAVAPPRDTKATKVARKTGLIGIRELIVEMTGFGFESNAAESWAGQIGKLQSAYAGLVGEYLKAALLATRKPTPDRPEGELLIHPAMKLLTGDRTLSGSKAADLIKRLLNVSPADRERLLQDEILRAAHDIAVRLRPTRARRDPETAEGERD